MDGGVGLLVEIQRAQTGDHDVLQIGLTRVDDVEYFGGAAEVRRGFVRRPIHGDPDWMAIRVGGPGTVIEIFTKQAELPKLVGDVFTDVGDGPVGADDHFAVVFGRIV